MHSRPNARHLSTMQRNQDLSSLLSSNVAPNSFATQLIRAEVDDLTSQITQLHSQLRELEEQVPGVSSIDSRSRPRRLAGSIPFSPIRANAKIANPQRHRTAPSTVMVRLQSALCSLSSHLCPGCAYKKGICSICGKRILDTTGYHMSSK